MEGAALLQGRAICGLAAGTSGSGPLRGRKEAWHICDGAQGTRGQPCSQSIAGAPIDEAVGALVAAMVTLAAVKLALEIH